MRLFYFRFSFTLPLLAMFACAVDRPATGTPTPGDDAQAGMGADASVPETPVADAAAPTPSVADAAAPNTPSGPSTEILTCVPAQQTIVVAADGSGQLITIGAALDSVAVGNRVPTLVSIRNGVYRERLALRGKGFITFRGEDRVNTRIESELAQTGCVDAVDGNGCSGVYVEGQDIAFDNLTIANTFAGSGKALALRTKSSTRIVLRNIDLPGRGGDTLILESNGLYYLSGVSLSGTYHIIVPRGTTWVSDSAFTCIGHPTCVFNEGIQSETQKMVIRNSTFYGSRPFGLGSYFRDAAWYFIDDTFSSNLLDMPIWRDLNGPSTPYTPLWGERIYFAGIIGPDYAWLKDNIATSALQSKDAVTLAAVFPTWNPGDSLVCP